MARTRLVVHAVLLACVGALLAALEAPSHAAAPAICDELGDAALAFDAPTLTGSLPAEGVCWSVPTAAGQVIDVSLVDGARVTVSDATGDVVCAEDLLVQPCALQGPGPFVVAVEPRRADADTYEMKVVRLTGATGCDELPLSTFGAEGTRAVRAEPTVTTATCHQAEVEAGEFGVVGGPRMQWQVFDGTQQICTNHDFRCSVPEDGPLSLVVRPTTSESRAGDLAVVPLGSTTEGCGGDLSTRWDTPVAEIAGNDRLQVHCRTIDVEPGENLALDSDSGGTALTVVDAAGDDRCQVIGYSNCIVGGSGPYRIVSWWDRTYGGTEGAISLVARSVSDAAGCPVVRPTSFGTADPSSSPVGCRILAPRVSGPHLVLAEDDRWAPVLDADGSRLCDNREGSCPFVADERYLAVLSLFEQQSTVGLTPLSSDGCFDLARGPEHAWAAERETGEIECAELAYDEDTTLAMAQRLDEAQVGVRVYDADGVRRCLINPSGDDTCSLDGPAPHRAVVMDRAPQAFHVAMTDLGRERGCVPLAAGQTSGVEVELTARRFASCSRVPREVPVDTPHTFAFERVSGSGEAMLRVRGPGAYECRGQSANGAGSLECELDESSGTPVTVLLVGDGSDSTWRITRQVRGAAGAHPVSAPELSGVARQGRELTVDPGTWRPRPDRYRFAWYAGERRLAADGRRLTLRRHHVGKRITVGVVAVAGGDRVGRATARSARVRGR